MILFMCSALPHVYPDRKNPQPFCLEAVSIRIAPRVAHGLILLAGHRLEHNLLHYRWALRRGAHTVVPGLFTCATLPGSQLQLRALRRDFGCFQNIILPRRLGLLVAAFGGRLHRGAHHRGHWAPQLGAVDPCGVGRRGRACLWSGGRRCRGAGRASGRGSRGDCSPTASSSFTRRTA